jgi:hypothetical protein
VPPACAYPSATPEKNEVMSTRYWTVRELLSMLLLTAELRSANPSRIALHGIEAAVQTIGNISGVWGRQNRRCQTLRIGHSYDNSSKGWISVMDYPVALDAERQTNT